MDKEQHNFQYWVYFVFVRGSKSVSTDDKETVICRHHIDALELDGSDENFESV